MNIPMATPVGGAAVGAGAPSMGQQDPNVKAIQSAMESCFGKTVMSGVMGFGMGGVLGMFMASMAYDTPFAGPGARPLTTLSTREQLKIGFRDMGTRSYSTAKNFGRIGAIFAGVECGIEGLRARNDMVNGAAAGCLTGAILAKNAGPQAMAGGCAAFAAFSTAIEAWMRQPKDE